MQLKKILGAGALATIMAGSSVAFAATLADYPQPFISSDGAADFLVVVGANAKPSDVVGAIDVAARLGSESYTTVAVGGSIGGASVAGEGKAVATTNTKLYLNETLGKSGLRNTMTKDELPTLLADGTVIDGNGTSIKYQQFIFLTPASATSPNPFSLEYAKPGAGGSEDPSYTIGSDITTSPSTTEYLYRTQVTFDKELSKSTAIGETIELYGKTYTIQGDTTFAGTPKLVLAGGSDKQVLAGGETATIEIGGTSYDITFVGASDATTAVIKVGNDQKSVRQDVTTKVGGLDVFIDDVFRLSTEDQTQNSVSILLGAEQLILQHNSKAKVGDDEDSVDGTYVTLATSGNAISSFTVYTSASGSKTDFVKMGSSMDDPLWGSFAINFASTTPTAADGDKIVIENSGDNDVDLTFTDYRGNTNVVNFAHKALSTDTTFSLQDDNAKTIHVVEGANITQDEWLVVDAGEFAHIYDVTGIDVDLSSSSSIELNDIMSGTNLKVTLGTDSQDQKVIDGQSYYFAGTDDSTDDSFEVSWGSGAGFYDAGATTTVFPVVETDKGARLALTEVNVTVNIADGVEIGLPTGSVTPTIWTEDAMTYANFSFTTREDGTVSAGIVSNSLTTQGDLNLSFAGQPVTVAVGRTTTGPIYYTFTAGASATQIGITVNGDNADILLAQPAVLIVEEKDDAGNEYSIVLPVTTETSGSNNVAIAASPRFTWNAGSGTSLGSDSDLKEWVDLWGAFVKRNSNDQDTVTVMYPDDQIAGDVFVLATGASTSSVDGSSASTIKAMTSVKTAVARLDSEVGSTEKTTKNLLLIGGPAVNTLVAELATAEKTWATERYVEEGAGTAIIQLVEDAFADGKAALVVAGYGADDTRTAAGVLLKYDENADKLVESLSILKNGVRVTASS